MKKMTSLVGKGFQPAKCKTQLRLGSSRIKLLRNKKGAQIALDRREVAEFLKHGQESNARLRVEHVIREQKLVEAYDLLYLYAERIATQLPMIVSDKTCPPELKEAISTLLYASSRCAELPDFAQIRPMFIAKYGKEFVSAAEELRPGCGVNGRVIEKLSVSLASGEAKLQVMKEIAAEHNVPWDPAQFEKEIRAIPIDLLDGAGKIVSVEEVDHLPSVPRQKPTLGAQLESPKDLNVGRFGEENVEPRNSPRPVDDARTGGRSGPSVRKPPGREGLPFDDSRMDPGGGDSQPRRSSRRESDSFAALAPSRHPDQDSRRNSIGVTREKTGSAFGARDESSFHDHAEYNRRGSPGGEAEEFGGSHRSERRPSQKYEQHVDKADVELPSYMKTSRPSQKEFNRTSNEDEHGGVVKSRLGTDRGSGHQTRQAQDLEAANNRIFSPKEGSGKPKPDFDEDYYRRAPSKDGSVKARGQRQGQELDEDSLKGAPSRKGSGKGRTHHEDHYAEEQNIRRASSEEDSRSSRTPSHEPSSEENFRGGRSKEGFQWTHRTHDYSDEDVAYRTEKPGRRGSSSKTKLDEDVYNPKWDSELFKNSVTTRVPRHSEYEHRDSEKGARLESLNKRAEDERPAHVSDSDARKKTGSHVDDSSRTHSGLRRKDNERSTSDTSRHDSSDHEEDPRRGGRSGKPEPRHNNTRSADRSAESGEEGTRRRRGTLEDRGKREDLESARTPRASLSATDHERFDSDHLRRMSLPGGNSKHQGTRPGDDAGRRVTIGPEEIHRGASPRYGERENHSDRRKDEDRQPLQRDRSRLSDRRDGDRPPRFLQPSPEDEYSPNARAPKDKPRKTDTSPRYDDDKSPAGFIKVGKQTAFDDFSPSPGLKPERFVHSPRRGEEALQTTPRPRSNLHSVKTDPELPTTPKTSAAEHRKSQSASDGQLPSKPILRKPPDLDALIQMFAKKK